MWIFSYKATCLMFMTVDNLILAAAGSSDWMLHGLVCLMAGFSVMALFLGFGSTVQFQYAKLEMRYDRVLNHQLLLNIQPRLAIGLAAAFILVVGGIIGLITESFLFFFVSCGISMLLPNVMIKHMEEKRLKKLNEQIVDGVTSLASGVRAGLNLVQSIELLIKNSIGPIKQEFEQLHREYQLGADLNQAMHNASDRIGSPYYRLLFGAISAHRTRGGDMGQSLDRIAESIREIQRLEGRLDALTAQGRAQARFMSAMPFVIMLILYGIMPDETAKLITEPAGRVILLLAIGLITVAFFWIRRIMDVDM